MYIWAGMKWVDGGQAGRLLYNGSTYTDWKIEHVVDTSVISNHVVLFSSVTGQSSH